MKKQKISILLVIAILMTSILNISALNPQPEPPIQILIDGKFLQSDTASFIKDNRVFVPMRAIFEAMNCNVKWFAQEGMIVASDQNNSSIKLKIGADQVFKNGLIASKIDTKPEIVNGRTMVPLRFVAEALGARVEWSAQNRKVNIFYLTNNDSINKQLTKADLSKANMSSKEYDSQIIGLASKMTKTPSLDNIPALDKDIFLDYSSYLTFTGNQDGWGGCIGRSMVHCVSLIKEIEHPYTPDLSFGYLGYWFEKDRNDYLASHPNDPAENCPPFSIINLKEKGLSSEALYPSDFDSLNLKNGVDSDGKSYQYYDLTELTPPPNFVNQEASLYKAKMVEAWGVDAKTAKYYMKTYGPVAAYGFGEVNGNANRAQILFSPVSLTVKAFLSFSLQNCYLQYSFAEFHRYRGKLPQHQVYHLCHMYISVRSVIRLLVLAQHLC